MIICPNYIAMLAQVGKEVAKSLLQPSGKKNKTK